MHTVCRIRLESIEARLSLTDKNIGTSARFYTYACNTEKSHTKKLCIFLTGGVYPLVWLRHCCTVDHIMRLQDSINKFNNNKVFMVGVFIGFKSTFDMM